MTDHSAVGFRDLLQAARVELTKGLSDRQIQLVEERFGIEFNPDHREFLSEVLPQGRNWPNWRSSDPTAVQKLLDGPIDGVLFDVERNSFWPPDWGSRPDEIAEALDVARGRLSSCIKLVPVWGHRYTPQTSSLRAYPVFSVVQTDVIYYARDLRHYFGVEFAGQPIQNPYTIPRGAWTWPDSSLARNEEVKEIFRRPSQFYVPFWSELAENTNEDIL